MKLGQRICTSFLIQFKQKKSCSKHWGSELEQRRIKVLRINKAHQYSLQTSNTWCVFPWSPDHYITITQHHGDLWPVRLRSSGLWFVAVQQFDLVKVSRFDLIVQMQPFTFGLATRRKESPRILVVLPSSRQHEVCSVNHSTSPLILHLYHLKTSQYFLRETPSWYGEQTWDTDIRRFSVGVGERGRRFAWGMIRWYTSSQHSWVNLMKPQKNMTFWSKINRKK